MAREGKLLYPIDGDSARLRFANLRLSCLQLPPASGSLPGACILKLSNCSLEEQDLLGTFLRLESHVEERAKPATRHAKDERREAVS